MYNENILEEIYQLLLHKSPLAAKKMKRNLKRMDDRHAAFAQEYFLKYKSYLISRNQTIEYGVDCYVRLIQDMIEMRAQFLQTGRYANTSFEEVNRAIYANADVMEYHIHGLLLAQFLWPDQYQRFTFFRDNLINYKPISKYLEIGGGHGIYVDAAFRQLPSDTVFDVIDISQSSLNLSQGILNNKTINYCHKDIFDFSPAYKYNFITIGEVLEHLVSPEHMLLHLASLLMPEGTIYMTTPVNAPMIDHIFLFNNIEEIRNLILKAGFVIDRELSVVSEDMDDAMAAELKIPIMYAAFLKKKK